MRSLVFYGAAVPIFAALIALGAVWGPLVLFPGLPIAAGIWAAVGYACDHWGRSYRPGRAQL